jgi:hypothetical protein
MANLEHRPGRKPVKNFKAQKKLETTTPQEDLSLQTLEATHGSLQNDKET